MIKKNITKREAQLHGIVVLNPEQQQNWNTVIFTGKKNIPLNWFLISFASNPMVNGERHNMIHTDIEITDILFDW